MISIAMRTPAPLACCVIVSIFNKSVSIRCLMSKNMLANVIFYYQLLFLKQPSSESCFISVVSTQLLVTTIAARILPSRVANILYFFDMPTVLVLNVYGS